MKRNPEFDMHCPEMMVPGLNYWKEKCEQRQQKPDQKLCYSGCKSVIQHQSDPVRYGVLRDVIRKLHDGGLTRKEILVETGAGVSTISHYVREYKRELDPIDTK